MTHFISSQCQMTLQSGENWRGSNSFSTENSRHILLTSAHRLVEASRIYKTNLYRSN